jgi:hypothetical protein
MTMVRAIRPAEAPHEWRELDVARPDLHWLTWPNRPHPGSVSACLPLSPAPQARAPGLYLAGQR